MARLSMSVAPAVVAGGSKRFSGFGTLGSEDELAEKGLEGLSMPAFAKLRNGDVDTCDIDDAKGVLSDYGWDESGKVGWADLEHFFVDVFNCAPATLEVIRKHLYKKDSRIDAEHFLKCIQSPPLNEILTDMGKDHAIVSRSGAAGMKSMHIVDNEVEVDFEFFQDHLEERVQQDDSLVTLLQTVLFFAIITALITWHLKVYGRQKLEETIELRMAAGDDILTTSFSSIADAPSFLKWVYDTGLPTLMNTRTDNQGATRLRVVNSNLLVGDVHLTGLGSEEPHWLLNSEVGLEYLQNSPGEYLGAARAALESIQSGLPIGWNENVDLRVALIFCTYNARAKMFAKTQAFLDRSTGFFKPVLMTNAVFVDPYPNPFYWVIDVLYILFTLYNIYPEVKEIYQRLTNSDFNVKLVCQHYWSYWNCIDWFTVVMAFANIGVWLSCCSAMQGSALRSLLDEDSFKLKPDAIVPNIKVQDMINIEDDLSYLTNLFRLQNYCVAVLCISIFLKFFKGFEANMNLTMVTDSLQRCAIDLAHFGIIFGIFFFCFTIFGHVLFGADLAEFDSPLASASTCSQLLLLDFGWFVDLIYGSSGHFTPSGMPTFVVVIWYVLFVVVVVTISMNILFGIILNEFCLVWDELKRDRQHSENLVHQLRRDLIGMLRPKKGQVPLGTIHQTLQAQRREEMDQFDIDLKTGCRKITKDALMIVMPEIPNDQVENIFNWIAREKLKADNREELLLEGEALHCYRLQEFAERIIEDVHVCNCKVHFLREKMQRVQDQLGVAKDRREFKRVKKRTMSTKAGGSDLTPAALSTGGIEYRRGIEYQTSSQPNAVMAKDLPPKIRERRVVKASMFFNNTALAPFCPCAAEEKTVSRDLEECPENEPFERHSQLCPEDTDSTYLFSI